MNVIELFSASGGMAEGLRRAGIAISMAFDFSPDACASYMLNLGHAPIRIDVADLLRMVRAASWWIPRSSVDLLIADPPCTPWSRAGKRKGEDDERDMLAETVELVRLIRPRYFLIANVPGLDDAPNWPTVQRTIGSLSREGWCIDFARLDAADYGVPQHRFRPFWFGHPAARRNDLDSVATPCIQWPARTHGSPLECRNATLPGVAPLTPWVTCRQALSHLSAEELGRPVRLRWRGQNSPQHGSVPDKPARVVGTSNLSDGNVLVSSEASAARRHRPSKRSRASHADAPAGTVTTTNNGNGCVVFDGPNHRPSDPDAPARTLSTNTHSDGALLAMRVRADGTIREHTEDAPAHTIRATRSSTERLLIVPHHPPSELDALTADSQGRLAPPGHHGKSFLSDNRGKGPTAIKLSEKAAAILQGFPDDWHFVGKTKEARWSQIGQAMPPGLAHAVGIAIVRAMKEGERDAS